MSQSGFDMHQLHPLDDPFAAGPGARLIPNANDGDDARAPSRPPAQEGSLASAPAAFSDPRNPLVGAAGSLLNLVPQIRYTVHHSNPRWLREHLASEIRAFEVRAQQAGISPEQIGAARYCLCTALDEAAALTPWGSAANWAADSLLVEFHNETWGGEKFFQVLERAAKQPREHLLLLELLFYCLALGFEGRYRVLDNGHAQLDAMRRELAASIRRVRGEFDPALSPHWRDELASRDPRRSIVPLWACVAFAVVLGFGVFVALSLALAGRSDRAFSMIARLPVPKMQSVAAQSPASQPAPVPRLALFLAPEVRAGLVTVRDEADRSVVVLRGDGLFGSGSTTIIDRYEPTLARVADALDRTPGRVVVAGYTDNQPVRTARFPSNWNLSVERAQAVTRFLADRMHAPGRLQAVGRADADPIASNDTAAGRAQNRRVEITLFAAPEASTANASPGAVR